MGIPAPVTALYRRLGSRYPRLALTVQFPITHVVVLGGVGLLVLYRRMSDAHLLHILLVAEGLVVLDNVLSISVLFRLVRPADPWLHGDHSEYAARQAWRALAGLPVDFVRHRRALPIVFNLVPISAYITWELGLRWYSFPILLAGAAIVLAYGLIVRFFVMELSMRPVLEDISRDLPGGVEMGAAVIPLRWKLLAALPAINIITGVVVSALSKGGHANLSDLGINVLVAVGVAFTISLELTLLLARSILAPIQELRAATERIRRGDYGARVGVISTDETGALAGSFNQMVAGLEEREKLREAFGTFVHRDLADRVLAEGTTLKGEDVEVSVLFADIRDFTGLAERSSAQEVVDELNRFYELVIPVLVKHGGHANNIVGDGLLGVFGAPERLADHADRAVAAGFEIAGLVRETYGDRLRIGIGINSGPVVAGTIGGGGHMGFTVIGDPVNTACRVEEATRATGDALLITEATRCLLTREFGEFRRRPPIPLKGKTERVVLYAAAALEVPGEEPVGDGEVGEAAGPEPARR
ncbi:MAG TPA: adenylate/guanylate cyclase domain-containing protein [Solirubrobacteraceae bacterium]|jgi:class 3 adenylate cyclase|nr:adenylate/guanylate cyclase domain-containing protein [Solirubrobacteraceae bacterium]